MNVYLNIIGAGHLSDTNFNVKSISCLKLPTIKMAGYVTNESFLLPLFPFVDEVILGRGSECSGTLALKKRSYYSLVQSEFV